MLRADVRRWRREEYSLLNLYQSVWRESLLPHWVMEEGFAEEISFRNCFGTLTDDGVKTSHAQSTVVGKCKGGSRPREFSGGTTKERESRGGEVVFHSL